MRTLDWTLVVTFLLLGGVVLLVCPFVILVCVMVSLAENVDEGQIFHFIDGVVGYMVVYVVSGVFSIIRLKTKKSYAVLCSLLPIFYICLVVGVLALFMGG